MPKKHLQVIQIPNYGLDVRNQQYRTAYRQGSHLTSETSSIVTASAMLQVGDLLAV